MVTSLGCGRATFQLYAKALKIDRHLAFIKAAEFLDIVLLLLSKVIQQEYPYDIVLLSI